MEEARKERRWKGGKEKRRSDGRKVGDGGRERCFPGREERKQEDLEMGKYRLMEEGLRE